MMRRKSKEELFLQVVGLNIRVIFFPAKLEYFKKKFIKGIKNYYQGFIISTAPKKIDLTIKVYEQISPEMFFTKIKGADGDQNFVKIFEQRSEKRVVTFYHAGLFYFQFILIVFLQRNLDKALIFHASAIDYHGQAVVFVGEDGAGKSTIIRILGKDHVVLAEDEVLIKKERQNYHLYQIPFSEQCSPMYKKNRNQYPVRKLFILKKANYYKIEKIKDQEEIISKLLKQLISPRKNLRTALRMLGDLLTKTEIYYLYFRKKKEQLIKLLNESITTHSYY
jgi:serine kinase of HPr protein (carbohydrate metabolism regulator)